MKNKKKIVTFMMCIVLLFMADMPKAAEYNSVERKEKVSNSNFGMQFTDIVMSEITSPEDIENLESRDEGQIYSFSNAEKGKTTYYNYYKFGVAERSWVFLDRYQLDGYTYYETAWNPTDLYYNASMTKKVEITKQTKEMYAYYLDPGTYYIRAGARNCKTVGYGYILPTSKVISAEISGSSLQIKFLNSAKGMSKVIKGYSSPNEVKDSKGIWNAADIMEGNSYKFVDLGKYSVRAEFLDSAWSDYPVSINFVNYKKVDEVYLPKEEAVGNTGNDGSDTLFDSVALTKITNPYYITAYENQDIGLIFSFQNEKAVQIHIISI